jgi:hypothetical protein
MVGRGETVFEAGQRARVGRWARYRAKFSEGYAEGKAERKTAAGKLYLIAFTVWVAGTCGGYHALGAGNSAPNLIIAAAWPVVVPLVLVDDFYRELFSPVPKTKPARAGLVSI